MTQRQDYPPCDRCGRGVVEAVIAGLIDVESQAFARCEATNDDVQAFDRYIRRMFNRDVIRAWGYASRVTLLQSVADVLGVRAQRYPDEEPTEMERVEELAPGIYRYRE